MGLLDGLMGPALTVATQSAGAHEQAKQSGSALLRQLGMQQLEQETKRSTLDMNKAHTDLYKAQAAREPKGSWSVHVTENGLVRVNPATGETEPLTMGGQSVQGPAKAQGHVVDPVTGDVKFFDPTKPPQGMKINPVSKPDHFTPVTVGGETPDSPGVIKPFDTKTGKVGESIAVAKPATPRVPRQPSEIQSRAKLVYPRAQAAAAELERFFKSGAPVKSEAGKIPLVGNFVLDKDEQMMNQAAETIASSILRLESGANYTKNEMLSYKKQFLPAPGDSKEVLAQKRATLQEQLVAMQELAERGAPTSASPASARSTPSAAAKPSAGDPESAWAAKNPPHPGESFEQYHARYLSGGH